MKLTQKMLAEFLGTLRDELAAIDGGGIDRNLVRTRFQKPADVVGRAHAAADGQRHEAARGRPLDDVEDRVAVLVACRDVEKAELVGTGGIIGHGGVDRVARIAQVYEVDAFHDAPVGDIEAGNDAGLEHGPCLGRSEAGSKMAGRPFGGSFSG